MRRARARALAIVLAACAATATAPSPVLAFAWPDVADHIAHDLTAADPSTRRAAARQLASLGESAGAPLVLSALGDADDGVRLAAAGAAIRLHLAAASDVVAGWLNAGDARLRRRACEVARALPNPRVIAPLARSLGDPNRDVRAAAAEALGRQASAEAVAPLLGRLDDPEPAVRVSVVTALARLDDPRAVVPLVSKVQDSFAPVRQAVVRALGDLGDARAAAALVLALRDDNRDVQRVALAALGRLRAATAVDAIAPFAADRSPLIRAAAVEALGQIASPDAVRALVATLGTGDDAAHVLSSTPVRDALVHAGAPQVVPALRSLLAGSPTAAAAAGAAWVLGQLHASTEGPAIVAAMRRGSLPTAAGLHALAGAGTANELPAVLELLGDPDPVVRGEAIDAAAALLDPSHPDGRAVEPLAAALRDARLSPEERARTATLLGRTGAARSAPLLVDLLRSPEPAARLAALDALGTLGSGSRETDDALLGVLGSMDPGVRLHAAVALGRAGTAHARDTLLAALDGGDEVDRATVLTALGGILARLPSDPAVLQLARSLDLAAGPERDAIVEALAQAPVASAVRALAAVIGDPRSDPADRRAAAAGLAAHVGDAMAAATARALLADSDAGVRAQAAWTMGALGSRSDGSELESLARGPDEDATVDATAALGRIMARARSPALARAALCPLEGDPRAYVRANALAGLALAGARCGDGSPERRALAQDPNEDVRVAAALAIARAPGADDRHAIERCARADPSVMAASRCEAGAPTRPMSAHSVLVYIVPVGQRTPRPGASFVMRMADGLLRAGVADRRGAAFDPVAPQGDVALRPASTPPLRR